MGYRAAGLPGRFSTTITPLQIDASPSVSATYLRILKHITNTAVDNTAKHAWQLFIESLDFHSNTIASSSNAHLVINELSITVCFSLTNPKGKTIINNTCLIDKTSLPFDSNEILSFEQQQAKRNQTLEQDSIYHLITLINARVQPK